MVVPDGSRKYLPAVAFLLVATGAKVTEGLVRSKGSVATTRPKDVIDWALEESKIVYTGSDLNGELLLEV